MAELNAKLPVVKIEASADFFRSGDFYVGAQPDVETLQLLKSQGVTHIVNLRTEAEMKQLETSGFNEEDTVKELGMSYCLLPVGGKDLPCPKTVEKFAEAIRDCRGKALVHCRSGGRATHLLMAHLVRGCGYTLTDAVTIGKQMMFGFMVEDFLGAPVSLTLKEAGK